MNMQTIYDRLLSCWVYIPGLNKKSFSPSLLCLLPKEYSIKSYTDTSIIFEYSGHRIYGHYEWQSNAWVFDKIN